MNITYRFSWEHPIFRALTFCLMVFSGFAIYVALMSVGRYGYIPNLQFFIPVILLFLVKGFKATLFQNPNGIFNEVQYAWYNFKLGTQRFEGATFKKIGKFYFLKGVVSGEECSTFIVYDSFAGFLNNKTIEKA